MRINLKNIKGFEAFRIFFLFFIAGSFSFTNCFAAPPLNDNCTNATVITIPASGYGIGTFNSAQTDITSATVQAGETFAPAIFVAALDKKSVWYKFSISTIRAVRITLSQPGTAITAGDVGFAVYQTNSCLPGDSNISSKLTPIVTFGNTYHPCVPSGDYLIQVSSNLNAKGPVSVQVQISDSTGANFDHPIQAYNFDTLRYYAQKIDFNTECQSIENASEVCSALANKTDYNKSAWFTFTTPAYFDYIVVQLTGTNGSYFPSSNNQQIKRTFGYTLYKGNSVTTPIGSLTTVDGCDSLQTDGYYAGYKLYKCNDLQPNTTYSIQLFIKKDFADDVRLGILAGGRGPTNAPKPILSSVPSPNAIGNLNASSDGTLTQVDDVWGCNSRHSGSACGPALPDSGIAYNGGRFNLSSFITFTLTTTCAINFNGYVLQCGPQPLIRVYQQGLTNNCKDLDTSKIIGVFNNNGTLDCLPPGKYTVQVSGQDYTQPYNYYTPGSATYNSEQCLSANLGTSFRLDLRAYTRKAANKYSLSVMGAVDSINRVGNAMIPLKADTAYSSVSDTMGCQSTLRPIDTTCSPANNKVMYREFVVADSGVVDFSNLTTGPYNSTPWRYRLYAGNASALASAQNVFAFPDQVKGLKPKTECFDGYTYCTNKTACVIPGTYTFTTMGSDADVGRVDKPIFTFVRTRTQHYSPLTAQDMGSIMDTLGANGGTIKSDVDDWSCTDNAVPINGYTPCDVGGKPATKAIYRQFYLKADALVRIDNPYYWYCAGRAFGIRTLFYGKATNGLTGLSPVGGGWTCFQSAGTTAGCELLKAGWYTVVSYNQGPSYDSTLRSLNLEGRYNSSISYHDEFNITITPTCPGPKYNRPYKASIDTSTKQPHLIQLVTRVSSTPAIPKTDTTYILPTEHFNCTIDTPFSNHPINSCASDANRVVYYVFKTTQTLFLQINTGNYYAEVFDKDVRKDSLLFGTLKPIQICNNSPGYIQFCSLQPGTYTLVLFAGNGNVCQSVTPSIYIVETGKYSRFDYAKNAYDFGVVPPDLAYHYGKVGDVNPLNADRKPSSDFFYCTTGASDSDPTEPVCSTIVNPNVYNSGPNKPLYDSAFPPSRGITRRNLWYTFVVDQPGYVKVKVESITPDRGYQQKFSVYQSDVDGNLPFSSVVSSGQVDSTAAQGLKHIVTNLQTWYYCANLTNEVSFYRDPCNAVTTRYYVLVENVNAEPYENGGTLPNTQTQVSVQVDSVSLILPKHDHYSTAGDIGTVGVGTYKGDTDNYSCATKDATDPVYNYYYNNNCQKTLWYKFTATITGNVRYRIFVNGERKQDYADVQLFRQIKPGNSTTNGLQVIGYSGVYDTDNTYWAQTCVSPGTYYLLLPGCDKVREYVYPEIQLIEATGDFCSRPITAVLNGPGAVSATVLVDCHTIGTDYGEFGPDLTCPAGAKTADYKTSWFRMDIGGKDTLDVTAFLVENTNASSSDIKYRLMTGDCGAMQEQSCVLDALTQNTYQCLVPGQSYYVQVFTPVTKYNQPVTGTIDLKLSAIAHADTCAPLTNCLANANFSIAFDCNKDDSTKFVNFSTYGTSISYKWDFGYDGKTSAAVSPSFFYPALATDKSYSVKLVVENISCGKKDSVTKTITIPGRPYIDFGNDISRCDGSPITLHATSYTGATYLWQNGSSADTLLVTAKGNNDYWVKINYNGCSSIDTVKVLISPIVSKPLQNIIVCTDSVSVSAFRGNGETYKWSNGSTASSIYVSKPGFYWADITYSTCTYRDSFLVNNAATARPLGNDTTVCLSTKGYILNATTAGANSYRWQDGSAADTFKLTASGNYSVEINFGSCTVKDTVNISGSLPAIIESTDTTICGGMPLTLPWGTIVNTSGIYTDTLRYNAGCDSLIHIINLTVKPKPVTDNDTTISICNGNTLSYTFPSGKVVNAPGVYTDTLRGDHGCDSLLRTFTLKAVTATKVNISEVICAGRSYTLPSGLIVNTEGIYYDTLKSVAGCDSLITTVNLTISSPFSTSTAAIICAGQTYTLPSGVKVNVSGLYKDTVRSVAGCDSIITTLNLTVYATQKVTANAVICAGQTYTLPSGKKVNTTGAYADTLKSVYGCDSLITTVNLTVNAVQSVAVKATICAGQMYTLPSGKSVNIAGVYEDTLKRISGCDSLITTVNLSVFSPVSHTLNATVCKGQNYNLPSGKSVTNAGTYLDTIRTAIGCDSLLSTVNLAVFAATAVNKSISICSGQTYTLPSGKIINSPGIYKDTVRSTSGCDSLIATVNLAVQNAITTSSNASICFGQTYTLPSGNMVNTAGIYTDTLKSTIGCDSLIRTINLAVVRPTIAKTNASVCAGQPYQLPSGHTVYSSGLYNDTLRAAAGCDSLITTVNLQVLSPSISSKNVSVCQGEVYTLPSGKTVNTTGIYKDTLRYTVGCDSIISIIDLRVKAVNHNEVNAFVCSSQYYTLPWGVNVNTSGVYSDTLRFTSGCDSMITSVNLTVVPAKTISTAAAICTGESYLLPSGKNVSVSGSYRDTLKSVTGCDSLIKVVNLTVNPKPALTITKSNDVDCVLGTAQLTATGATRYLWSPASSLSNAGISSPVASPLVTTMYKLRATSNIGCVSEDSVEVKVITGDIQNGYLVASAFTPNGDGLNDCFGVKKWGNISNLEFSIYDRAGFRIFYTQDPSKCWDGTSTGGERLGSAAYVYQISANTICGRVYRKGTVVLIR